MKLTTKLTNIPMRRTLVSGFGGLNRTPAIAEGGSSRLMEFAAMKDLCSDGYPAAQTRYARFEYSVYGSSYGADYQSIETIYNGGLFTVCKRFMGETGDPSTGAYVTYGRFTFGDWDADGMLLEENSGKHQLINMAAYIIIFPEGVWFDTVKAKEYIENYDEETGESTVPLSDVRGKIELAREYPLGGDSEPWAHTVMVPCFEDGTPAKTIPSAGIPLPYGTEWTGGTDDMMCGIYNADKSEVAVYRWMNTGFIYQTDRVFRLENTDIGKGFFAGDEVMLDNVKIKKSDTATATYDIDLGTYATVLDAGDDFVTLRFADVDETSIVNVFRRLDTQHVLVGLAYFALRRPLPEIKFVTEWNNRLWGCGGENNSVIYASALGNPRSWSVYENTAADSYWMNVGDGEDWTGAATFEDHAYFFKQNKFWKIFGSRPANFQSATYDFGTIAGKSIAPVGTTLFWASRDGVYAYAGGMPLKISDKLGDEWIYGDCVGFGCGGKYYLYCARVGDPATDEYKLYVYDTTTKLWHEEQPPAKGIFGRAALPEETLINTKDGLLGITGAGIPDPVTGAPFPAGYAERTVEWSFDSPEFASADPDFKYICKIQINCEIEENASATVSAFYDGSGAENIIGRIDAGRRRTQLLPICLRRCQRVKLRVSGKGYIRIYSISYHTEGGSEYGKR